MTEATGSQSPNSKAPWEQAWNTVTNTISEAGNAVKNAVLPSQGSPWEKMWGITQSPPKPPTATPNTVNLNGSWDDINKRMNATQGQREQDRLVILQSELANEKDPKNIAALKRQIASVKGNM